MANKQGLKIFLSHASEDTRKAEELNLALLQDGREVFFDRHSLPAGVGFHSAIRNEIFKADLFLFLVSPAALTEGRYTLTELTFAEERWHNPSGRILPVMVSKTDFDTLPPYLKAVTVFRAKGNLAAEVVDCVLRAFSLKVC